MPIMYLDEYRSREGLGAGIWGDIADWLGLRDPLTYYYPELTPRQIYVKIDADLTRYKNRITLVRSATARRALTAEFQKMQPRRDDLKPAFTAGARPGERDLERLRQLLVAYRAFRSNLWNAESLYGTGATTPMQKPSDEPEIKPKTVVQLQPTRPRPPSPLAPRPAPTPTPAPVTRAGMFPAINWQSPWVWGGAAVVGLSLFGGAMFRRPRRRRA